MACDHEQGPLRPIPAARALATLARSGLGGDVLHHRETAT